jgi:hypothetical protein
MMSEVHGLPRDHVVICRKTGLYLEGLGGGGLIWMLTPELPKAQRFALVVILMQDLATAQNGCSFAHQDDPRLATNWPLTEDEP